MKVQALNKVKWITTVGLVLGILRSFFPDLDFGEDFQTAIMSLINSLFVIIPVAIGWFVKETRETRDSLVLKD